MHNPALNLVPFGRWTLCAVGISRFSLLLFFAFQPTAANSAALIIAISPLLTALLAILSGGLWHIAVYKIANRLPENCHSKNCAYPVSDRHAYGDYHQRKHQMFYDLGQGLHLALERNQVSQDG